MAIYAIRDFSVTVWQADGGTAEADQYSSPTIQLRMPDPDKSIPFSFPVAFTASATFVGQGVVDVFRTPYHRDREFVKPHAYHFTLQLVRRRTNEKLPGLRLYKPRRGFQRILVIKPNKRTANGA